MILGYSETQAKLKLNRIHTNTPWSPFIERVPQKYMKYFGLRFVFFANDVCWMGTHNIHVHHAHTYGWVRIQLDWICYLTFLLIQTCFWHWYSSSILRVYYMLQTSDSRSSTSHLMPINNVVDGPHICRFYYFAGLVLVRSLTRPLLRFVLLSIMPST